jgi:hypothetical protein
MQLKRDPGLNAEAQRPQRDAEDKLLRHTKR